MPSWSVSKLIVLVLLKQVKQIVPGGGGAMHVSPNTDCTQHDKYGDNDCSLNWGTTYTLQCDLSLPTPITAGYMVRTETIQDVLSRERERESARARGECVPLQQLTTSYHRVHRVFEIM
jgi:hypothetical protein